jgi:hypothetical protein
MMMGEEGSHVGIFETFVVAGLEVPMRKMITALLLSLALLLGLAGAASAQSDRACVGTFVSGFARSEPGALGQTVRQEAKDFHPFGQVVSVFATTCDFPE